MFCLQTISLREALLHSKSEIKASLPVGVACMKIMINKPALVTVFVIGSGAYSIQEYTQTLIERCLLVKKLSHACRKCNEVSWSGLFVYNVT